jgi:hypothetical protein
MLFNGDYEYSAYFRRNERGKWVEAGSSSGHAKRSDVDALDPEL